MHRNASSLLLFFFLQTALLPYPGPVYYPLSLGYTSALLFEAETITSVQTSFSPWIFLQSIPGGGFRNSNPPLYPDQPCHTSLSESCGYCQSLLNTNLVYQAPQRWGVRVSAPISSWHRMEGVNHPGGWLPLVRTKSPTTSIHWRRERCCPDPNFGNISADWSRHTIIQVCPRGMLRCAAGKCKLGHAAQAIRRQSLKCLAVEISPVTGLQRKWVKFSEGRALWIFKDN